jgi:hypothetical protein
LIRQHTGFRFPTAQDKRELDVWLRRHAAPEAPTEAELCECAYARLRALGVELPTEKELRRIVRAALRGFFYDVYTRVSARLPEAVRATLDELLVVGSDETQSAFAQFIRVCSRPKWSKHRTKSPLRALLAMAGSKAAYKISSACWNAFWDREFRRH